MADLKAIATSSLTLLAFAAPAATARVCWQVALDRGLPDFGFPGVVKGGSAYVGAILLGILAGLMILEVERAAKWAHLVSGSVGFFAQDVATVAIVTGRDYSRHPRKFFRLLKTILRLK